MSRGQISEYARPRRHRSTLPAPVVRLALHADPASGCRARHLRAAYLAGNRGERVQHGTPHWVIADEAHLSLTDSSNRPGHARAEAGTCLVTWQPAQLPPTLRQTIDYTVTVTGPPPGNATTTRAPHATIEAHGGPARTFTPAHRASRHVRTTAPA